MLQGRVYREIYRLKCKSFAQLLTPVPTASMCYTHLLIKQFRYVVATFLA
jgi:hypothetical protein